jgi:hypothetical protein
MLRHFSFSWSRARAGPGGTSSLPSDPAHVVSRDSASPPPPVITPTDQHLFPTPLPLDAQKEREPGTDLDAALTMSPSEEGADFSRSLGPGRLGRKRKRPPSPTKSVIHVDEHEGAFGATSDPTTHLSVQQASPARRKRGRPRKAKPAETKGLGNDGVTTRHATSPMPPALVSRTSEAPPTPSTIQSDSEPLRVCVPSTGKTARPLHEVDGLDEEEEEENEEDEEKEEGGERRGSMLISEDSVPRLSLRGSVLSSTRAGSVESTVRVELKGPAQRMQSHVPPTSPKLKGSSHRSKKRPSKKNGDKSNNSKNPQEQSPKIFARSKDLRPRRPAEITQSSPGSTSSTARLVRTVRAKKRQLTARPSFFVDTSKPQLPSYSDDDEIYSEDEEEEEEEEEEGKEPDNVGGQRRPISQSSELEAWAMDESVQDWIS